MLRAAQIIWSWKTDLRQASNCSWDSKEISLEIFFPTWWYAKMLLPSCLHGGVKSMIFFLLLLFGKLYSLLLTPSDLITQKLIQWMLQHDTRVTAMLHPSPWDWKLIISVALPHLIWTNFLKSLDLGSASSYCSGWDYVPGNLCFSPLVLLCWITGWGCGNNNEDCLLLT